MNDEKKDDMEIEDEPQQAEAVEEQRANCSFMDGVKFMVILLSVFAFGVLIGVIAGLPSKAETQRIANLESMNADYKEREHAAVQARQLASQPPKEQWTCDQGPITAKLDVKEHPYVTSMNLAWSGNGFSSAVMQSSKTVVVTTVTEYTDMKCKRTVRQSQEEKP